MVNINKRSLVISIIGVSLILSLTGCSNETVNTPVKNNDNQLSQSVENKEIKNDTKSEVNKENIKKESKKEEDVSKTETKFNDYKSINGRYVDEEHQGKPEENGGTFIDIIVDDNNNVAGTISSVSHKLSHIANADIQGSIKDDKIICSFKEDGWGNSGTLELTIDYNNKNILNANIKIDKNIENQIWGISSNVHKFVKQP